MTQVDISIHYRRIIEISQELGSTFNQMDLLKKIVYAAAELVDTEEASILLLDDARGERKLRFAMSTNIQSTEMDELIVPIEGSIAGWIVTHSEPRVISDVSASAHFRGVDNRIRFNTRNLLGVPMVTRNKTIGVVQAVNKRGSAGFTDEDIVTLRTLASQAAMAIETARLFHQSDFMGELVHELRTPLSSLRNSVALFKRDNLPESIRLSTVQLMEREVDRLIQLTTDFLDLARLESGRTKLNFADFNAGELLVECAQTVSAQAEAKAVSVQIYADDNIHLNADRGKIKQVLLNLLTNAIKYNRPEGQVRLVAEVATSSDGKAGVRFYVADTGYGIPTEHQKRMFEKFFRVPTLEDVERGTGLGLTISKHIVEAHEGAIWLESEEGVGSTFYFILPHKA